MPEISNAERIEHYRNILQLHTEAMANAMRDMRTVMDAGAQVDMTPEALLDHIADLQSMLGIAEWHAQRMRVYHRLLNSRIADRDGSN